MSAAGVEVAPKGNIATKRDWERPNFRKSVHEDEIPGQPFHVKLMCTVDWITSSLITTVPLFGDDSS